MPSGGELVGRQVDGEIVGREERAGGDQGDDADDRLHQHGAVADHPGVGFLR